MNLHENQIPMLMSTTPQLASGDLLAHKVVICQQDLKKYKFSYPYQGSGNRLKFSSHCGRHMVGINFKSLAWVGNVYDYSLKLYGLMQLHGFSLDGYIYVSKPGIDPTRCCY